MSNDQAHVLEVLIGNLRLSDERVMYLAREAARDNSITNLTELNESSADRLINRLDSMNREKGGK